MSLPAESIVSGAILVPLEFNPDPGFALAHASIIKKLFAAPILLVTKGKNAKSASDIIDGEVKIKSDFLEWLQEKGKEARYVMVAKDPKATRDSSGLYELIRSSPIPVISVGESPLGPKYRNLLMPFDLTRETRLKVSKAVEFSEADPTIRVQVISVLFSVDDFVINRLSKQIEEVRYALEEKGVLCATELIKTDESETMAEVVTDIALRNETDLLVIMAQVDEESQTPALHKDVLQIINHTPIPVMTINPSSRIIHQKPVAEDQ